ncbi:GNAT family N-acetyltransferase [Serratia quinivorans]|uniref:GNAT family N-acetyltransferase n=1 Tax=Serratia quinivorans TaxID=137545 RepID=A0ABV3UDF5_9GAMM
MAEITDPHDSLVGFQMALDTHGILPKKCVLHTELSELSDYAESEPRLTYALIENGIAKGIVIYVAAPNHNGIRCLSIGYAVVEQFRNQGIAKELIEKSIDELRLKFKGKIQKFYIVAVIDKTNILSQKVASQVISQDPMEIIEVLSNKPAYRYVRLIE